MKRSAVLQERISLFPFLAVLICTMGSLLVLLVVLAQRAQAKAETQRNAEMIAAIAQTEKASETLQADIEVLNEVRKEASGYLAERRRILAHIEDHMRRVGQRLRQLQNAAEQLHQSSGTEPDALRGELARLLAQLEEAKATLEEMKSTASNTQSYAIVPYIGKNGTQRRPIYIECLPDGVVIQPEGVRLSEDDFRRPLGPENPLAAGLRAYSSYLRDHLDSNPQNADPYPLLLVRPSGISAYYAARAAIKSWTADFGYELIDDDWPIDFELPDPALSRVTHEAVQLARPRHDFLVEQRKAAIRMQRQRHGGSGGYGHLVDAGKGRDGSGYGKRYSSGTGTGMHGSDVDRNRAGLRKHAALSAQQSNSTDGTAGSEPARAGSKQGEDSPGDGRGDSRFAEDSPTYAQAGSPEGQATANADSPHSSAAGGDPTRTSAVGGTSPTPSEGTSATGSPQQQGVVALREPPKNHLGINVTLPTSMADVRGSNWALPDATAGAVPFSRTMRVDLWADQLILIPSDPRKQTDAIEFDGPTESAIEHFVSTVWKHMRSWGIAGRGLYWKPVLNLYVHPGGEHRAAELEALLHRSGLEFERK